jgi:predicted metal-dependent phosphoesterase TrpH
MTPETLVRRAQQVGLDGVAVTDHNTMDAVEAARQAAAGDLLVIPAEEVDTPGGQIIGLFLSEPIEPWQSPDEVIEAIHEQGGVALAPHPFDDFRKGLQPLEVYVGQLDAIEGMNSRCVRQKYNDRAVKFAQHHGIPCTGGSDAHFAREVGRAYTELTVDGFTQSTHGQMESLKRGILEGRSIPRGRRGSFIAHAGTKLVKQYNGIFRGR